MGQGGTSRSLWSLGSFQGLTPNSLLSGISYVCFIPGIPSSTGVKQVLLEFRPSDSHFSLRFLTSVVAGVWFIVTVLNQEGKDWSK